MPATNVYAMATICLFLGLVVGYFFVGKLAAHRSDGVQPTGMATPPKGEHPRITLEQMKQMADVQASALIEKSKADPENVGILVQIAGIYQASHQFKEATDYLEKALKIDPKNVPARTQMASCLYYSGDVDGAISQLNQALKYNPNDVNSLFNLGVMKYQGKKDPAGAIAIWQQLLKNNPNLDRKPIVEKMIAEAKASPETRN
jgi:cytochrome c-type biogenesis protein CcmH/NrfG